MIINWLKYVLAESEVTFSALQTVKFDSKVVLEHHRKLKQSSEHHSIGPVIFFKVATNFILLLSFDGTKTATTFHRQESLVVSMDI